MGKLFEAIAIRHVGDRAVGKVVKSIRDGLVVYTDGTYTLFSVNSSMGVEVCGDLYDGFPLLVPGVISGQKFNAIKAELFSERDIQSVARERKEYARLKAKYDKEPKQ